MSYRIRAAGLLALALAAAPARAADFDAPYPPRPDYEEGYAHRPPPPPPPPEPVLRAPRFSAGPRFVPAPESCRVFVKRRFDADGEPVIRRVRVCDEPDDRGPPSRHFGGPRFEGSDFGRPDFDGPRPPADIPHRHWDGPRW